MWARPILFVTRCVQFKVKIVLNKYQKKKKKKTFLLRFFFLFSTSKVILLLLLLLHIDRVESPFIFPYILKTFESSTQPDLISPSSSLTAYHIPIFSSSHQPTPAPNPNGHAQRYPFNRTPSPPPSPNFPVSPPIFF